MNREANSRIPNEISTAAMITSMLLVMPTAVITESSENTRSSTMIWAIVAANVAVPVPPAECSSTPSSFWWISCTALYTRNSPPTIRMRSRPENSLPHSVNSGLVSVMIQPAANTSPTRMNIPRVKPRLRALACISTGNLEARIEMNTTLSTPSTISRTNNVRKVTMVPAEKSTEKSMREERTEIRVGSGRSYSVTGTG